MKINYLALIFTILGTSFVIPVVHDISAYQSICNLAGANSTEIKQCVKGYLEYQKMNHSTDSQMQQILDSSRDTLRHEQKLQDPNATQNWVELKGQIAHQMEADALAQRDWYYTYTHMKQNDITSQIKWWKAYDHNVVPAEQSCPRWTDCTTITQTAHTNSSSITLKPEFSNHTSGIINNPTIIKNFYDLQKWLDELNKTKVK